MSPTYREVPSPLPSVRLFVRDDLEAPDEHELREAVLINMEAFGLMCADDGRDHEVIGYFAGERIFVTECVLDSGEELQVARLIGAGWFAVVGGPAEILLELEGRMLG